MHFLHTDFTPPPEPLWGKPFCVPQFRKVNGHGRAHKMAAFGVYLQHVGVEYSAVSFTLWVFIYMFYLICILT